MSENLMGISVLTLTMTADGDISSNRAVCFNGKQATNQGQKVMGVSITGAECGETFGVVTNGTAIVETGSSITVGGCIVTSDKGRAVHCTGNSDYVWGDALTSAQGAGEFIEVLLRR